MEKFSDDTMCRICFKKQDSVFSLFRKRKGISPFEKLIKIGLKPATNDTGPTCICCDCLTELETTVNFLEKCQKSNQVLAEYLNVKVDKVEENKVDNFENRVGDVIDEYVESSLAGGDELRGVEVSGLEEPRCEECGSRRRCRHWAPPATHTCPHCQKVFTRKFNFKLHLARHSGSREFWCSSCGAGAASRWLAARHCRPRARRPCPLPGCGKTYSSATNLAVHLRAHSGERPFECNDCGKKFSSKNTLQNHIRIHTGALPYICAICGAQFRTNKLAAHMARHAGARPPRPARAPPRHPAAPAPHACAACPARYHHKQSLRKHVRKHHAVVCTHSKINSQAGKWLHPTRRGHIERNIHVSVRKAKRAIVGSSICRYGKH
nr:zinc finger protein 771 isoform X1 [Helicoverpa armigera]